MTVSEAMPGAEGERIEEAHDKICAVLNESKLSNACVYALLSMIQHQIFEGLK